MGERRHVLLIGGAGQVGREVLAANWPGDVLIHAPTRSELNLADATGVQALFTRNPFSAVINAGAWTAVDDAEKEVAAAFAANAVGPAVLAQVTRACGIPMVQVSTDYVFDGETAGCYLEDDTPRPLGVYGASKLAGELAVRSGNPRSVVLRTAWVLSVHRSNFLKTMLALAEGRDSIRVVADQIGCPTSARDIAHSLKEIALKMMADPDAPTGIYHFVNAGEASWAGLATEIFARSAELGGPAATVEPITTAEYPTLARRPKNSRLATEKLARDYGVVPRRWTAAVAEIVAELQAERVSA